MGGPWARPSTHSAPHVRVTMKPWRWIRRGGDRRVTRIGLSSYSRGQKISKRQWPGHKYSMYTELPEGNGKPQGVTFAKKPNYEVKTKANTQSRLKKKEFEFKRKRENNRKAMLGDITLI